MGNHLMNNINKIETFRGDQKYGTKSLLTSFEQRLILALIPYFPSWIQTYHLTLLTILWSGGVIFFGFLAKTNLSWLWLASVMIALQWFTDSFDGSLGKYRKTGLIRWGYYMDHFLDYIFLCSILIAYFFIVSNNAHYLLFFILSIFGAFMVNSYLAFGAMNQLKINYLRLGPTELRIIFILANTLIIYDHTYLRHALPFVLILSLIGLCSVIFRSQKYIWQMDMREKKLNLSKESQKHL